MSTATIQTVTKMLESLPDSVQERAVEHFREYLEEITDEMRWDENYRRAADKLSDAAHRARQEAADGGTSAMDLDRL